MEGGLPRLAARHSHVTTRPEAPKKSRLNNDLDVVNGWSTFCTDTAIMHRPAVARLAHNGSMALAELPPPYLAPSLHFSMTRSLLQTSSFSTTPAVAARHGRDMNRTRGVSAIHRTGTRFNLSASKYPLPKPVSPEQMKARPATPNHGLWGFFPPTHEALSTTEYDAAFGKFTDTYATAYSATWFRRCSLYPYRSAMVSSRAAQQELGGPSQAVVGVR